MGEGWGLHPAILALPAPAALRPSEPHILVLLIPDWERLGPQGSEEAEAQGQEQGLHAGVCARGCWARALWAGVAVLLPHSPPFILLGAGPRGTWHRAPTGPFLATERGCSAGEQMKCHYCWKLLSNSVSVPQGIIRTGPLSRGATRTFHLAGNEPDGGCSSRVQSPEGVCGGSRTLGPSPHGISWLTRGDSVSPGLWSW